jgi:hypothetical protein
MLAEIVESVSPHSRKCLKYFSQLFDEKPSPDNEMLFGFIIPDDINAFALIHQNATPPHFAKEKIKIANSSQNLIEYKLHKITSIFLFC